MKYERGCRSARGFTKSQEFIFFVSTHRNDKTETILSNDENHEILGDKN